MLSLIVERALRGEASPRADLDFLEDSPALDELVEAAHLVTTKCASRVFNFCTIVNAKSGRCAEDCRWCSQSSKWTTNAPVFPIVPATRGESAAARALEHGIRRLSFVTSGRKLSARELREIRPVVEAAASTGLEVCASMGLLTEPELTGLREAGLVRYHCNLETGPNFFPKVCTTHTQTDKIRTLEAARRAGLELCSGGLFGMGETIADRIDLACGLRRLEIPSIPLNFLIPIPGTPLADRPPMTHDEVVRTVAVFRLVNPSACLRFAGGRQNLAPETARAALRAGINGAITGDLLTTPGSSVEEERRLVLEAGYSLALSRIHPTKNTKGASLLTPFGCRPPHSRGPRGFRPICSSLFKKHVGADFAHAADAPAHSVEHEGKQNEEDDEEEYLGPAVLLPVIVRTH